MITQLSQIERSLSKITNPSYSQLKFFLYQQGFRYFDYISNIDTNFSTTQGSMRHLSKSQSQITRSKIYTSSHPESQFLQLDNDILEIYDEFEKNYNAIQEIDKTNTKIETKQKIIEQPKIIQQQKKLLKTFDGLQQSDLEIEFINRIQIVRFRFYYFRIRVKGKQSPLQILLNFPSKITSTSYKLFVSTSIEFPNKFNADQSVQSRFVKINSKQNSKLFFDEYVYLTFYSEFDAIIGMQITFGEQYTASNGQKFVQSIINFDIFQERKTVHPKDKILQNIEMVKTKMYSKIDEMIKAQRIIIQIVRQTYKILGNHQEIKINLEGSKINKINQTIGQRLDCSVQGSRKNSLERIAIIDICKEKLDIDTVNLNFRFIINQQVLIVTTIFHLSKQIHRRLEKVRRKYKIAARANLLVWQLHTKTLIEVRRYGDNPFIRSLSKSSLALSTFTSYIQEKCFTKAEKIFSQFLVDIILYQTFINKHIQLISKSNQYDSNYQQNAYKGITENSDQLERILKINLLKPSKKKFMHCIKEEEVIKSLEQILNSIFGFDFRHIITKLFEEYSAKIKHQWIDSRRAINVLQFLKKSFSVQRQDIKLYSLPNEQEMQLIIQQYYKFKKQLS